MKLRYFIDKMFKKFVISNKYYKQYKNVLFKKE